MLLAVVLTSRTCLSSSTTTWLAPLKVSQEGRQAVFVTGVFFCFALGVCVCVCVCVCEMLAKAMMCAVNRFV